MFNIYLGTKTSWDTVSAAAPVNKISLWGIQMFGFYIGIVKSRK